MSPPPPTGTSSRSSGPASSNSSAAAVPSPATMSGWSKGGTSVSPRSAASRARQRLALLAQPVVEDDLGAVAARGLELRPRRVARHDDHRRGPEQARHQRHRLRVVARGVGDHAARQRLRRQPRDGVVGAAELERPHALQVLALEEHGARRCARRACARWRPACGARPPRTRRTASSSRAAISSREGHRARCGGRAPLSRPRSRPAPAPGSVCRRGSSACSICSGVRSVISRASSRTGRRSWNARLAISAARS